MPQVRNEDVVDGFYRNCATDADDKPRAWGAATVNFKPGQVRHVPAAMRMQARSVNDAFKAALANGSLQGPAASADGPWTGVAPAPKPVEPPAPPAEDPEPPPAEEDPEPTDPGLTPTQPEGEPEGESESEQEASSDESAAKKASKKRRRRSKE
jgi:hypothetical protein